MANLLRRETRLSNEIITRYAALLENDGATDLQFLVDAQYTGDNLLAIGISRPHVKSVLRAIQTVTIGQQPLLTAPMSLRGQAPAGGGSFLRAAGEGVLRSSSQLDLLLVLKTVKIYERLLPPSSRLVQAMGVGPQHPPMDTCEALTMILSQRHADPEVVSEVLKAIRRLIQIGGEGPHKINRERFGILGLCEMIIYVAKDWSRNVKILRSVALIISYLAGEDENRRIPGAKYGACERIVNNILTVFPTDEKMQCAGLKATLSLAYANADNQERLGGCGTCEKVIDALKAFPQSPEIQSQGLLAVDCLSFECPNNRKRLGFYGYKAVIDALSSFPACRTIQLRGLRAIRNLAFDEHVRNKMGAYQGCEKVVAALDNYPSVREIQVTGFQAIAILMCDDEDNTKALLAAGVCDQICKTMIIFSYCSDVQYQGCMVLQKLVAHEDAREALITAGVGERLKAILSGFPLNNILKLLASQILGALGTADDMAVHQPYGSVSSSGMGDVGRPGTSAEQPYTNNRLRAAMWAQDTSSWYWIPKTAHSPTQGDGPELSKT